MICRTYDGRDITMSLPHLSPDHPERPSAASAPDPATPAPPSYEAPDPERPATASPTEAQLEYETPGVSALDRSPAAPSHDPYAALRYPDYIRFQAGWMLSVIGNLMTLTALQWEIYDKTKRAENLGWLGGVQALPLLALALFAGAIADYFDRRRIIAVTSLLAALTSLGFAAMSYNSSPYYLLIMYGLLLVQATVLTLGRPARSSILPNLVPQNVFSNAVTWNASIFQVAAMVGPMLAGVVLAHSLKWFGNVRLAYLIDAGCAVVFAIIMFTMPKPQYGEAGSTSHDQDTSAIKRLTAGISFVRSTKMILATITLDLFAVLLGGAVYLLPVFAKDILHVGPVGFTWLRAAEAIGAITMALLVAHMPPMRRAGRAMLIAVAGFGAATIGFGLSRSFALSFACIFLIGAFDNISVVVRHTLVQVLTPDRMRGRVSAVNNIFIGASNELGGLESGLTAHLFAMLALGAGWAVTEREATPIGATISVVVGGIGTILVVTIVATVWRELLKLGSLNELKAIDPDAPPTNGQAVAGVASGAA